MKKEKLSPAELAEIKKIDAAFNEMVRTFRKKDALISLEVLSADGRPFAAVPSNGKPLEQLEIFQNLIPIP